MRALGVTAASGAYDSVVAEASAKAMVTVEVSLAVVLLVVVCETLMASHVA